MLVVLVKIRDPVGLLRLEPKLSDKVNLQLFGLNLVYTAWKYSIFQMLNFGKHTLSWTVEVHYPILCNL